MKPTTIILLLLFIAAAVVALLMYFQSQKNAEDAVTAAKAFNALVKGSKFELSPSDFNNLEVKNGQFVNI
jgi:uncharacterized protein YpmB